MFHSRHESAKIRFVKLKNLDNLWSLQISLFLPWKKKKIKAKRKTCVLAEDARLSNWNFMVTKFNYVTGIKLNCTFNCDNQSLIFRNDCSFVISKIRMKPIASRKNAVVRLRNLKKKFIIIFRSDFNFYFLSQAILWN